MTTLELGHQLIKLQDTLKLFTRRFTNDEDESKDLVQETVLKALANRDRFIENTNIKGWLYTIMKNIFINNYRKNKRAKTSSDTTDSLYFLNVEDTHTFSNPDGHLNHDQILEIIDDTKEEFLIPFKMYLEGYKYNEIADQLDIPMGTVKTRIFYARKEIQSKLAQN